MTKMIVPPLQLLFHQRPLLPPLLLKKAQLPKLQSHQHQHFQEIQIWPVEISQWTFPIRPTLLLTMSEYKYLLHTVLKDPTKISTSIVLPTMFASRTTLLNKIFSWCPVVSRSRPMKDKTNVVARMEGEYNFVLLGNDGPPLTSTPLQAKMGIFHFVLPDASASS